MTNISNHDTCGKPVTRKRNRKLGIIIGCQRMTGTLDDLVALLRNGLGAVRTGRDYRVIASEAFETWRLQ
jgi:hypothetical protein